MTDERRLFLAIRSGKRNEPKATFQYLYSKYKPLVCFIAARYFREKADIEDVVQCEDGQDEILPRFEEIQKCKGGLTMKKIEEEFLQTFESSLGAEVSFEEIEKKIDPEKYRREPSRGHAKAGSRRIFGILSVAAFVLVAAIVIPTAVLLRNQGDPALQADPPATVDPQTPEETPPAGDPSTGEQGGDRG